MVALLIVGGGEYQGGAPVNTDSCLRRTYELAFGAALVAFSFGGLSSSSPVPSDASA